MVNSVCDNPWTVNDFSNVEKLQNGVIFGQLIWCGSLTSFKRYDESGLDQAQKELGSGLLQYYEAQIGVIDRRVSDHFV